MFLAAASTAPTRPSNGEGVRIMSGRRCCCCRHVWPSGPLPSNCGSSHACRLRIEARSLRAGRRESAGVDSPNVIPAHTDKVPPPPPPQGAPAIMTSAVNMAASSRTHLVDVVTPWPRLTAHYKKIHGDATLMWDWFQGFFYSSVVYFAYPASVFSTPTARTDLLSYTFLLWFVQMTGALAIFHRYFAHRGYRASRPVQFVLAVIGCLSGQGGPIFWASMHRHHHKACEDADDVHSPLHGGSFSLGQLFWSHAGYLFLDGKPRVRIGNVPDWVRYPELVVVDILSFAIYYSFGFVVYWVGGWDAFAWVFCLSTFISWNCVALVNSVAHMVGDTRYLAPNAPTCNARNIWYLSFVMLGANWHNNHHAYAHTARAGFEWYQLDIMYLVIRLWGALGIVYDIREPDPKVLAKLVDTQATLAAERKRRGMWRHSRWRLPRAWFSGEH